MGSGIRIEVKSVALDVIEPDPTINTTEFLDARDWVAKQIQKTIGVSGSAGCTRQRSARDSCK